jgi:hypothetical protein
MRARSVRQNYCGRDEGVAAAKSKKELGSYFSAAARALAAISSST